MPSVTPSNTSSLPGRLSRSLSLLCGITHSSFSLISSCFRVISFFGVSVLLLVVVGASVGEVKVGGWLQGRNRYGREEGGVYGGLGRGSVRPGATPYSQRHAAVATVFSVLSFLKPICQLDAGARASGANRAQAVAFGEDT